MLRSDNLCCSYNKKLIDLTLYRSLSVVYEILLTVGFNTHTRREEPVVSSLQECRRLTEECLEGSLKYCCKFIRMSWGGGLYISYNINDM